MGDDDDQRDVVDDQRSEWLDSSTHRTATFLGTCDHRHCAFTSALVQHDGRVAHVARRRRPRRDLGVVGFPTSTIGYRSSSKVLVGIRYVLDGDEYISLPWCVLSDAGNGDESLLPTALEFFLFRRQVRLVTSFPCGVQGDIWLEL